jgi:hypothetical protein
MDLLGSILTGLAMGIMFGFALEKSRVFEPGMIVGQMQLRNFTMLKIFLAAVATGAIVLAVLHGFGWTKLHPKPLFLGADLVGGLILGVGIALAGACPGTVLAQVGVGYRDAIFTLIGGIAGATAFTYAEPALAPFLASDGFGKITFADLTGIPFWILALALALLLIVILVGLEKWRPWREDMGRDVDGDFGGGHAPGAGLRRARRIYPAE